MKQNTIKRSFLSLLLSAVMLLGFLPMSKVAALGPEAETTTGWWVGKEGSITVTKYENVDGNNFAPHDGTQLVTAPTGTQPLAGVTYGIKQTHELDPATGTLIAKNPVGTEQQIVTGVDGVAKLEHLAPGRYEMREISVPADVLDTHGNVVKHYLTDPSIYQLDIPVFDTDGKLLLKDGQPVFDVYVYPKNSFLNSEKKQGHTLQGLQVYVKDSPMPKDIGVPYFYTVETVAPADINRMIQDTLTTPDGVITNNGAPRPQYKTISFSDTLDTMLDFDTTYTPVVQLQKKGQTDWTDVTANVAISAYDAGTRTVGATLNVVSTPDWNVAPGDGLRLVFMAKLNDLAIKNAVPQDVPNKATVTYNHKPRNGADTDVPIHTTETWTKPRTGSITLKKVSSVNGAVLAGAKFQLYRIMTQEEATAGAFGTVVNIPKSGTPAKQGILIGELKTTPDTGIIEWTSLAADDYLIVETEAPAGYNTLIEAIPATVKPADTTSVEPTYPNLTVQNVPKGRIPETGGIGTLIFSAIGLLLMAAAIVYFVKSKKKGEKA